MSSSIKALIQQCKKATLLKDLIWPAVAGNVAWTFFSVLLTMLQPKTSNIPVTEEGVPIARLIAIFLLSCYLAVVYLMSCTEPTGNSKQRRDMFDILHSLTIILCAISFQLKFDPIFCNICLSIFWVTAAFGHLFGAWIPDSITEHKCRKQFKMSLVSIGGLILCWAFYFLDNSWNLVISLLMGLIFWGFFRHKCYS